MGNPSYPGATSADGPNYVDFLTTTYNQSFIETFNLGYGGATIDPSLVGSPYGYIVQSFRQQVQDEFLPTYASNSGVQWSGSNSLFTVFFGINDVILSYGPRNSTLNFLLIKSYENLVHQVRALSLEWPYSSLTVVLALRCRSPQFSFHERTAHRSFSW